MYNFKFTIDKKAKILLITKLKDISKYVSKSNNIHPYDDALHCATSMIDFEHIMKDGYDAIELIHGDNYMELHSGAFNTWDCDSIIILNKDIIEPL